MRSAGGIPKRVFDICFATLALLSLALPMLVIALLIRLGTKGPVLFAHQRVGLDGRLFPCLKFRTMVVDADARLAELLRADSAAAAEFSQTRKLRKDPRIIPIVGTTLRKLSLDELPQFFNVLVGQMSVVGPRPVTPDEISEHYGWAHPYTKARPGITGLWQVSGRNDLGYDERMNLDAKYVRNLSFGMDLMILVKTAAVVCLQRNGH
ncbi:sugar transferase [Salipiger aestuarii]|nr:sugar transferase [Salipiger aestuarii]KAA8610058.1 sugar transferase [Salipiger aestuarii]KAB2541227.1 sugar transferase [Salipiger aestuarii]